MPDFDAAHAALRAIMLASADGLVIARDDAGHLEVRTPGLDTGTKQPGWFGMVAIKKSYVAYHLFPLYENAGLADGLSPALEKRRQGKTCFNFKAVDPMLFSELDALTRRARQIID